MPVTIEDVARELNLSVSTVSKALNDYRDIPEETKARVVDAAARLGYHPSSAARSLRRHRTQRIGVVNATLSYNHEYFMELLRGVTVAAEQTDYNVVLYTNVHHQPQHLQRICRSREVDGVLLMSANDSSEAIESFMAEDLPLVALGRREPRPDISYIAGDALAGGALATQHLIDLGHHRIGFLSSLLDRQTCGDRLEGYRQALGRAGLPFDQGLVVEAPFKPGGGTVASRLLLQQTPRPTALGAIRNTLAHEAMRALTDQALRVPQDVALVAFDDTWLSVMTNPPLTSVRQPLFEMGQQAVRMLVDSIAYRTVASERQGSRPPRPAQRVTCPVSLVVRASTVA